VRNSRDRHPEGEVCFGTGQNRLTKEGPSVKAAVKGIVAGGIVAGGILAGGIVAGGILAGGALAGRVLAGGARVEEEY